MCLNYPCFSPGQWEPFERIKLESGLHQGDPLSPFLYLVVAKGLSIVVSRAAKIRIFEEAMLDRRNMKISHLQDADDTIFLGTANREYSSVWI